MFAQGLHQLLAGADFVFLQHASNIFLSIDVRDLCLAKQIAQRLFSDLLQFVLLSRHRQ